AALRLVVLLPGRENVRDREWVIPTHDCISSGYVGVDDFAAALRAAPSAALLASLRDLLKLALLRVRLKLRVQYVVQVRDHAMPQARLDHRRELQRDLISVITHHSHSSPPGVERLDARVQDVFAHDCAGEAA